MAESIRYVHTCLIARDWKKLAQFYIDVFGCEPVGNERDLKGDWIDKITGIKKCSYKRCSFEVTGL